MSLWNQHFDNSKLTDNLLKYLYIKSYLSWFNKKLIKSDIYETNKYPYFLCVTKSLKDFYFSCKIEPY